MFSEFYFRPDYLSSCRTAPDPYEDRMAPDPYEDRMAPDPYEDRMALGP